MRQVNILYFLERFYFSIKIKAICTMNFVDIIHSGFNFACHFWKWDFAHRCIFGKLKLKTSQMSFSEPDVANIELVWVELLKWSYSIHSQLWFCGLYCGGLSKAWLKATPFFGNLHQELVWESITWIFVMYLSTTIICHFIVEVLKYVYFSSL